MNIKNKKPSKSQSFAPEKTPQEFLASFIYEADKNLIVRYQKDIVSHLYDTALSIPLNLRQDAQETDIYLGLSPTVGDSDYKERKDEIDIQIAILNILKQYGVINNYKAERSDAKTVGKYSIDELALLDYDIVLAKIKFFPTNVISYYEDYRKSHHQFLGGLIQNEPKFDGLNGIISFGNKTYSFQKGREKNKRLLMFKEFWDERRVIKNNKIKREGKPFPPETVATRIGTVDSPYVFGKNPEIRKGFRKLIKNLNTSLRKKEIPIKIIQRGGIQIVVKM